MKIIKILAGVVICLSITSCTKDVLDKQDLSRTSDETVWSDINLVNNYVNYFYSTLPGAMTSGNVLNWDVTTDIGDNGLANDIFSTERYANATQANWSAADKVVFYNNWTALYQNIRRANDFLQRIEGVTGDENLKKRMKAEVRFFRALYYFQLTNMFSDDPVANPEPLGVPIIEKAMVFGTDSISVPRNTKTECVNYVVSELDQAATELGEIPASYTSQAGRITKGAALALKGRMLLYAGRWAEAATASKAVMDMAGYILNADYSKVFTVKNNPEAILSVQYNNILAERGHKLDYYISPGSQGGYARWNPTQNLVDSYELTDGKLPSESPLYDAQNPYLNRDKRFYATVVYDGSTYRGKVMQLYSGGYDINNGGLFKSQTNYYLRKFANETNLDFANTVTGSDQNWILIRLGEVLLNYAEAENEAAGPDESVYNAVNQLRTRAGLPNLPVGLSQSDMRDRIRRERKVELAFEDFRFWDVRRWRIADQPDQLTIKGITVSLNTTTGVKTYSPKVVETRPFPAKFYTTPIPIEEMNNNKKMVQNFYWK
ncbi:RagB/SusD family nutrient uptake outer membrane protein [Solitalea sp. MAHUQ-68]|uniref:RagB/SusD family nutrient uptake outer membrane protein n=1 Tax=Solitalea agri TaxID=2953739 RepID=A0A9X2F2T0_9SPHI|nr:RagB/SusD family nutrient uptake outer membrane protein [Solitalea agri]MCO4293577.1 RagB/SusD family nutrient uptake outer membrane protein [Solitalea agri]